MSTLNEKLKSKLKNKRSLRDMWNNNKGLKVVQTNKAPGEEKGYGKGREDIIAETLQV